MRRGSPPHSDVLRQALCAFVSKSNPFGSPSSLLPTFRWSDAPEADCETAIAASEAFPSGARGFFLPSLPQRREKASGKIHLNEEPHLWAYQSGKSYLGEPICPHLESEHAREATRWHISDLGEFQSRIMNPNYESWCALIGLFAHLSKVWKSKWARIDLGRGNIHPEKIK